MKTMTKMMKRTIMAAVVVPTALCMLPAAAMAYRWAPAAGSLTETVTPDPSCWTDYYGEKVNNCSTTEPIYFYPSTDWSPYDPTVDFSVDNPSSSSTVECDVVGVGVVSGSLTTYASGYQASSGSGYQTLTVTGASIPDAGAMYIRCNVPPNGGVVNYYYDENGGELWGNRGTVGLAGQPVTPSCWSGYEGRLSNTCSSTQTIYYFPYLDENDGWSPVFINEVKNPSSSSLVECGITGVAPDLTTFFSGFSSVSGAGYGALWSNDEGWDPEDGAAYITCQVPEDGAIVNVTYTPGVTGDYP